MSLSVKRPLFIEAPLNDGEAGGDGLRRKILDYVSRHGADLSFTQCFWKQCEPHPREVRKYPAYVKALLLKVKGKSDSEIASAAGVSSKSIYSWTRFREKPKLAHYLGLYLQLGEPRPGWVWLSVNNTPGHAIPLGPFVQVPKALSRWEEIADVLAQLSPLEPREDNLSREYLFGFLVGMIIGDAAKSRTKNWHRHLGLVLSKKYETNLRIGDFTCVCARNLGLRMHRVADQPRPAGKPHGFYEWVSQASSLVDWIFNVVLGLKDGERTTYDAVKMDWVMEAPVEFRRGLVQGVAESDGSVAIASQTVEFWIGPNWDFFKGVLSTFGVKSFQNREALSVTKKQVANLAKIPPFNPLLMTVRYLRFERLVRARHIGHGKRVPHEIRAFIMNNREGHSIPELSSLVLDRFGVVLNFEAVQRWARKGSERAYLVSRD